MPGPVFDCYVLAPARSAELARRFLDCFLPDRLPSFDPSDPAEVLGVALEADLDEILRRLESEPDREFTMYWSNRADSPPFNAVLSFTADGALILGLASAGEDDLALATRVLDEMKALVASPAGYIGLEEPPACSKAEFLKRAEVRS